jgi:hypothetical protein
MAHQLLQARRTTLAVTVLSLLSTAFLFVVRPDGITPFVAGAMAIIPAAATAAAFFAKCWSRRTTTGRLCGNRRKGFDERCSKKKNHNEWFTLHDILGLSPVGVAILGGAVLLFVLHR